MLHELSEILKEYGWTGLFGISLMYFLYKMSGELVKHLFNKIKKTFSKPEKDLTLHSFFIAIDYAINVEIESITVFPDKPVRQMITKDLMNCTLNSMKETTLNMTKNHNDQWSINQWTFEMKNMINDMNSKFIIKCISKNIPNVIYVKHLEWYSQRLNYMTNLVDQLAVSDLSTSIKHKTDVLLMLFNLFVSTMMADCETTMTELNGEITGLIYNGRAIEPFDGH